jgi:hypothetical protein
VTIKEKIEYVKNRIDEAIESSPISPVHLNLYTLTEYEDGPTMLSRAEQRSIVKKLEDDEYIKDVMFDDDGVGLWFKKVASKARRSSLLSYIKNTDELLQRRELFEKFLRIVDIRNIKPSHVYKIPTEEKNDDLIQLLIDLKVVKYDWKDMEKQTHRIVGNRIIEFQVKSDDVLKLYGRVSGKNTRIKKQALELISKDIGERFTLNKIIALFTDFGVPETMFIEDTKWRAVFYILSYYTSSEQQEDYFFALKLIQETLHPLMFEGNEKSIQTAQDKYKKWLKYDGIDVGEDGKLYIAPTEEELELGIDDWVSIDGDVIEPKSYSISQDNISELWVLLSQLIMLVQTYQNNFSADKKELEKLYLEVIGKIERLIETGDVGKLRENYKRPFTSLSTAEVETKAKKADSPLSLITDILLEVTSLNPSPEEIAKQLEENASLIERITSATRAITGDNIDYQKISYEQAVFLLKLVYSRIFNILESISTGYIHMTDERLNARYIILSDNLNGLLERKDMDTLRQSLPEIPKHLFEWIDEVDVWWENGGKSSLMNFYGEIEAMWVRTAQQTFPIPQWFGVFLTEVDNSVTEHTKTKAAHWSRMLKNVDDENKRNDPTADNGNPQQKPEPIHIIIDDVKKDIGIRGLEEKVVMQKSKNKKIHLRKLPNGTRWQDITIKFLNGQEAIIAAKGETFQTNYVEMGFEDEKKKQPNSQWSFLKLLASKNGELSWDNNNDMSQKQINSAKKQKQTLADALKTYFQIDEDPFENYRTEKAYKIKIILTPEDDSDNHSGDFTENY